MHWRDEVRVCVWERGGERKSNVIRWQLTAESFNTETHSPSQDACFYIVYQQTWWHSTLNCIFMALLNWKLLVFLMWFHKKKEKSHLRNAASLLQLCLVSLVGFILYCINYLPDEKTSMQFVVKVSLYSTKSIFLYCASEALRCRERLIWELYIPDWGHFSDACICVFSSKAKEYKFMFMWKNSSVISAKLSFIHTNFILQLHQQHNACSWNFRAATISSLLFA